MEHKIDEIIPYNFKGEDIYLEVIPTKANSCQDCFFYKNEKTCCSAIRNIIGICDKNDRTDKTPVIFRKINNKLMKKKKTIDIYVVMQSHKNYRSFCDIFTSFEEADNRFEELLNYYKNIEKIQPIGWTTETIPSQIKVSVIKDTILYLCKDTREIDIEVDSKEPTFDEPKFKPFSYADDCIKEMLKHSPFGIVKTKENIYCTILDISEYGITILNDYNKADRIDFEYASKFIKFLDDSPFGNII